jgi:hypothetical protein
MSRCGASRQIPTPTIRRMRNMHHLAIMQIVLPFPPETWHARSCLRNAQPLSQNTFRCVVFSCVIQGRHISELRNLPCAGLSRTSKPFSPHDEPPLASTIFGDHRLARPSQTWVAPKDTHLYRRPQVRLTNICNPLFLFSKTSTRTSCGYQPTAAMNTSACQ